MYWKTAQETLLQTLADQPRLGLVTDVDGTISPIVAHPDAAQVTPRARELLRGLARVLPLVAVVSGRAVADVRQRVGLDGIVYVGNHGLEWWIEGQIETPPQAVAFRPAVEAARDAVRAHVVPGMLVEDKGATLSVHYRQTADPDAVATALQPVVAQIAAAHDLKLYQGRRVFELRPPLEIDKGSAFRELVTRYALDGAVYIGDDTTDADALRAARQMRDAGTCYALGLGVKSGATPDAVRDSADLLLDGIQDVESFLAWLLKVRAASST